MCCGLDRYGEIEVPLAYRKDRRFVRSNIPKLNGVAERNGWVQIKISAQSIIYR